MATLHPSPVAGFAQKYGESFDAYMKREQAQLDALIAASDKVPTGSYEGCVIHFPVADGRAYYLVKSAKPVVLQHIPYGDRYQVDAATIRGLRLGDVEAMVRRERALTRIFAAKAV